VSSAPAAPRSVKADFRPALRLLAALALILCACAPASAQIYSWRDADGQLVLSDRLNRAGTATDLHAYPVSGTEIRATRPASTTPGVDYDQLISEGARRNGLREDLVRAVVQVESGFNPYARSPKGALGLMQLMPATIRQFGVSNPFNPVQNVDAGTRYLRQLLDRYANDERLALAAYNAGPATVDRHHQGIPPYVETRRYVERVTGLAGSRPGASTTHIYKIVEIIDGREVVRYTDRKPSR
jgi:soluble lytic murein transglycosylase-like protein